MSLLHYVYTGARFTPHGNIVDTANDFRQTVRIAVAGTIALSIFDLLRRAVRRVFRRLSADVDVAGASIQPPRRPAVCVQRGGQCVEMLVLISTSGRRRPVA